MKRVVILGRGASGKSNLARRMELQMLLWNDDYTGEEL
jgi:nicotinamide riboside kinase